jgi:Bacterial regulatory helix-turn-helix protein, lysR family
MQSRNPLEVNILIVIIAQEGSFERASKKLGMAPPSLTRRVAWLERNIGGQAVRPINAQRGTGGSGQAFRSGVVALPQPRGTRLGPGPVSGADRQRALPCGPLGFNPADTAVIMFNQGIRSQQQRSASRPALDGEPSCLTTAHPDAIPFPSQQTSPFGKL